MGTGNPANQGGGEWATEPVALAAGLLHAVTPEEVAGLLLQDQAIAAHRGCVMWSTRWPREISAWPPDVMEGPRIAAAMDAVAAIRSGSPAPAGFHVLHDGGDEVAVLHGPASLRGAPEDVGARFREVLAMQRIQETVARLQDAEKLQRSLYAIADMAGSDLEMTEMLRGLHRIVADLMYAENFYIAQYDRNRDSLRFLYFADVVDTEGPSPDEEIPLARIERGLTWYLTRDRRPLMGNTAQLRAQVSGELRLHGADSSDWLGVPMLRDGEVVGAVVVQSYKGRQVYTPAEMSLLAFVAEHILTALERKRGQAELERRVVERTLQLEEANGALRHQVAERERGERLQAALYRIAALAGGEETSERFYRHVHAIVGELIDARNFYIALRSEDGQTVSFPYARDAHEKDWSARSCGRGLTEYVLRTGRPQLVGMARAEALLASGEISAGMMGSPTRVWLGAPLLGTDGPIGVVAVQSYESEDCYTERDAELLTFVSYQIASSLQRRRAAVLLKRANAELERRVEERTRELREQIAVREQIEAQLQHQVMHDTLTTLPNRAYLRDRLERALKRVQRDPSQGFGLLYIDVDRFKLVNDSLGHRSGDAVLKQVALRLAACVRDPDVVARLAGDEFVILLEHVPLPETASKVAQRVLRMLQAPLQHEERELQVCVSNGIPIVDQRYDNAHRQLHDADVAL
jgi:diguanylate cyclase (GGDEF)-like protein